MSSAKMVGFRSSDGVVLEVEAEAAAGWGGIRGVVEKGGDGDEDEAPVIPMPSVSSQTLAKIIEFCRKHAEPRDSYTDLKAWDAQFFDVEQSVLFDLVLGANYLGIRELLDGPCGTVADQIKGKTPEEIRTYLNVRSFPQYD